MCDYTGRHFGAPYDDACCIDGYLWDLDSGDRDGLTSGGDIPCPLCNVDTYVGHMADEAIDTSINDGTEPCEVLAFWLLGSRMRGMHGLGAFEAAVRLGQTTPIWFGGKGAGNPDVHPPVGRIAWPWPLPQAIDSTLSAHERMRLMEIAGDPGPGFVATHEGWRVQPLQPGDWD